MSSTGSSSAIPLPPAPPGSTRYFVQLYCPAPRRAAFATLLAISDEIGAALSRRVDHSVAHVRLEWWRQEARRFGRSVPEHPWLAAWLRASPTDRSLELEVLTEAATVDLATVRLSGGNPSQLGGAVFSLAARLLGIGTPTAEIEQSLRALGQYTAELEYQASDGGHPASGTAASAAAQTQKTQQSPASRRMPPQPASALQAALQPVVAPLLVWTALAQRKALRREGRPGQSAHAAAPSRFELLADNLIAWRAARRAMSGRYRFD